MKALLALEDGTLFWGEGIGAPGQSIGELCFNTSMTGYQEILTDPSYAKQIVTLTYPHVGNVGINRADAESSRIYVAGLVIRDLPRRSSSWRGEQPLSDYLREGGVVALAGIDTRKLTRLLREKGAQNAALVSGDEIDVEAALRAARAFPGLNGMDLATEVSTGTGYEWAQGSGTLADAFAAAPSPLDERLPRHVVAYDYGVKRNILRMLVDRGCRVTVVPAHTPVDAVMALQPDGIFLSNGPGDPEPLDYAQRAIRTVLDKGMPVYGICLGHQLLCLALGAKSLKMKFGHHGANHPVKDLDSGRVFISSQNHGFAIDADTLPGMLRATHVSLFDGSLQGVEHTGLPAFTFQGHPEASPGPHEMGYLFDRFIRDIDVYRTSRTHA